MNQTKKVRSRSSAITLALVPQFLRYLKKLDQSIERTSLESGIEINFIPTKNPLSLGIHAFLKVGVVNESQSQNGISHLLEHLMFRGSKKHPSVFALAGAFEKLGGDWNAATGYEFTEYWFQGLQINRKSALELFADFLFHPLLQDFATERNIIFRELDGELNELGHFLDPFFYLHRLFWPNTSLAQPILGTKESLGSITLQDVKNYYREHYYSANIKLCLLATSKEKNALMEDMISIYSKFSAKGPKKNPLLAPLRTRAEGPHFFAVENPDNQYQVHLSFASHYIFDDLPHYDFLLNLLVGGYCSLLLSEIREKMALVYDLDADFSFYHQDGLLTISASLQPEHLSIYLQKLMEILTNLRDKGPNTEDLERSRNQSFFNLVQMTKDTESLINYVGLKSWNDSYPDLAYRYQKLLHISSEEIRLLCQRVMIAKQSALVIFGPKAHTVEDMCLKILKKF